MSDLLAAFHVMAVRQVDEQICWLLEPGGPCASRRDLVHGPCSAAGLTQGKANGRTEAQLWAQSLAQFEPRGPAI